MEKSDFKIKIAELIESLIADNKIVVNDKINIKMGKPSSLYRMNTTIDYILSKYDIAKQLVAECSGKYEFKYCLLNADSPYDHVCPVCGKPINFNGTDYDITCRSKSCLCSLLLNNPDISDKHQFVRDNYLNGNLEFSDIQIGFIEKYHVYNNSQLSVWKAKMKNTWNNKSDDELQKTNERRKSTCREKYGCDFSQQNPEIIEKQKVTWSSKSSEDYKIAEERRRNTCINKYGVIHPMKSKAVIEKYRQRYFEEHGYRHWIQQNVKHKDLYFDDQALRKFVIEKYKENDSKKVKKQYFDEFFNINVKHKFTQLKLMKYVKIQESELENSIKQILDTKNIPYQHRNRSIITGVKNPEHKYELDFYLPDYKICIEINDLASHNAEQLSNHITGNSYHLYKTLNCQEQNIRLIHIWEWELHNSFEKLSKWLLNELNTCKSHIFAKNCTIKRVPLDDEKIFLNDYHLQGYTKSDIALGLYLDDELIQIMTFGKPRFTKKYEYELIRLCTKYDYAVVGGAQRLFTNFIKDYDPTSIISYCDFSKFSGSVYERIGMRYVNRSKPTVTYCNYKWKVINESILIKYGIDNLLGTSYGKGTDNKELILKEGYLPVYNCGNLIYEWKSDYKK